MQINMQKMSNAIHVTPAALAYIRKCIASRGHGIGLRLHLKEAGCSGYKYQVDYVDEMDITQDDKVFPIDDDEQLAIYVNKLIYPDVMNTRIDYRQEGLNWKLVFENPQQTGSCGCGESIAINKK